VTSKSLEKSYTVIRPAIEKLREAANEEAYASGREARLEGRMDTICPYSQSELRLRHFWLAGWHDQDMESQISLVRFPTLLDSL
jgi:ribosome modulation factor